MFKTAVIILLLFAMLPKSAGALTVTDPLCSGTVGIPTCSAGNGFTPACSNGETPTCGVGNQPPTCSGTMTTPTCASGSAPQCPNGGGLIDPSKVIFSGHALAAQSILMVSLLIMLVMSFAVAIIYGIGYSFRLDKLLRFAKSEIGEIILTLLIVMIFVGTFTLTSAGTSSSNFFAAGNGLLNNNIFVSDCSLLSQESFELIPHLFGLGIGASTLMFFGSLTVNLMPNYMGVSFRPIAGITALTPVLNTMIFGTWGAITILMGVGAFLVIIYSLFPLFLYIGIILRTLPWTRPAGGAFLGMFIAFYIMFPLLIYFMLVSYVPYIGTPGLSIPINPVNQNVPQSIVATCLTSQDSCQIFVNNNEAASGIGSAIFDPTAAKPQALQAGCYNVVAEDMQTDRATMQVLQIIPAGQSAASATPCQSSQSYTAISGELNNLAGVFNPSAYAETLNEQAASVNPYASSSSGPVGLLNGFVYNDLEPVLYSLFSVTLSLIIAFDFMEAMGDILGAPSLRSQNMLKRVL